jgi:hypothetical protein
MLTRPPATHRIISFIILAIAMTAMASTSSAMMMGTVDCSTAGCLGGSYTLVLEETSPDMWKATYTISTAGDYRVDAKSLVDIEFKVAKDYADPQLISGPSGDIEAGPLSGTGCKGENDSFVCVNLNPDLDRDGSEYIWMITFGADSILGVEDWHLGARYTSPTHQNGWVISETPGGVVPEPAAAVLFVAGILIAGGAVHRRRD